MSSWIFGALLGFGIGCLVGIFAVMIQSKIEEMHDLKEMQDEI